MKIHFFSVTLFLLFLPCLIRASPGIRKIENVDSVFSFEENNKNSPHVEKLVYSAPLQKRSSTIFDDLADDFVDQLAEELADELETSSSDEEEKPSQQPSINKKDKVKRKTQNTTRPLQQASSTLPPPPPASNPVQVTTITYNHFYNQHPSTSSFKSRTHIQVPTTGNKKKVLSSPPKTKSNRVHPKPPLMTSPTSNTHSPSSPQPQPFASKPGSSPSNQLSSPSFASPVSHRIQPGRQPVFHRKFLPSPSKPSSSQSLIPNQSYVSRPLSPY